MIEDQAREDIAFIRRTIEEGGAYATARGPDLLVWGIAVAIGYLGTYGFIRGWSPVAPRPLWAVCIGLPWLYSLRRLARGLVGGGIRVRGPMALALAMLWLGCGIFSDPPGDLVDYRRAARRLVQRRCRRGHGDRILRRCLARPAAVAALGRDRVVGRRAGALRTPLPY